METVKAAPLILRLGRRRLLFPPCSRGPVRIRALGTTSAQYRPAQLPPSPGATESEGTGGSATEFQLNDSQPPRPRRSLRPYVWATAFLLIGVFGSGVMRAIAFPPPLPEPGSDEDEYLLSKYRSELNSLPIVTELRKDRDAWREYDPYGQRELLDTGTAADGQEEGDEITAVERHLTAGSLRGSRGLAVQRSFYNASERREITVMFFGGAASGWPGVTHGGVLATVLQESVERVASGPAFASGRDGEGAGRRRRFDCNSLTLKYKKPTKANNFYVIRAEVVGDEPSQSGSVSVKASIENALSGKVTVDASAMCSPSTVSRTAMNAGQNAAGGIWDSITGFLSTSSQASS